MEKFFRILRHFSPEVVVFFVFLWYNAENLVFSRSIPHSKGGICHERTSEFPFRIQRFQP